MAKGAVCKTVIYRFNSDRRLKGMGLQWPVPFFVLFLGGGELKILINENS